MFPVKAKVKNGEVLISNGIKFYATSGTSILLTEETREKMVINKCKDKFFEYLKVHKNALISELMIKFDIDYKDVMIVLNELKKEGKIKLSSD